MKEKIEINDDGKYYFANPEIDFFILVTGNSHAEIVIKTSSCRCVITETAAPSISLSAGICWVLGKSKPNIKLFLTGMCLVSERSSPEIEIDGYSSCYVFGHAKPSIIVRKGGSCFCTQHSKPNILAHLDANLEIRKNTFAKIYLSGGACFVDETAIVQAVICDGSELIIQPKSKVVAKICYGGRLVIQHSNTSYILVNLSGPSAYYANSDDITVLLESHSDCKLIDIPIYIKKIFLEDKSKVIQSPNFAGPLPVIYSVKKKVS